MAEMNRRSRTLDLGSSSTGIKPWILPALVLSLLLHAVFWMWSNKVTINPLSGVDYDPNPPRRFQLASPDLDPRLLNPAPAATKQAAAAPVAVKLPDDHVGLEKFSGNQPALPPAPKLDNAILSETPQISPPSLTGSLQSLHSKDAAFPDDKTLTSELLSEKPSLAEHPAVQLPGPGFEKGVKSAGGGAPGTERGFSNLDDLLAQTGPLTPETAPILMPTDLLFDYDSPDLRIEALVSLRKLALLIQRNPGAHFVIEGHTDSFGSDEYNIELSRKRAESVKAWLTESMGLKADSIQTVGYGKSRLLAPADGTVEQQQVNRRVEIAIHAPEP
jgi:outer membrane protein OmpA-like peptidoglycan-associated protein